jgi:hypothetical protein
MGAMELIQLTVVTKMIVLKEAKEMMLYRAVPATTRYLEVTQ